MKERFPAMVRISERTFEIRTKLNGDSGRVGVKGRDERQSTAPLTPTRPPREAVRTFQLTGVQAVIHGARRLGCSNSGTDLRASMGKDRETDVRSGADRAGLSRCLPKDQAGGAAERSQGFQQHV